MNAPVSPIDVQYQLTRREAVAQFFRLLCRPKAILSGIALLLLGVVMLLRSEGNRTIWSWALIGGAIGFFVALRRTAARIVDQHPEYLEVQKLTFDQDRVCFTNSVTRVQWPWQRITKVIEKRDFILLYCGTLGTGGFVPNRAFTTEQRELFLAYARQNRTS